MKALPQGVGPKVHIAGLLFGMAASAAVYGAVTRPLGAGGAPSGRATVCGSVVSTRSAVELRGAPVFLTLSHAYDGQDLTVAALGEDRAPFAIAGDPIGQRICVSGRILRFFGRPRMVLDSQKQ